MQFIIPAITEGRYLGGMAALNLPTCVCGGDWHLEQTFFRARKRISRSFISGEGCPTNTNPLFGDTGIYDCTHILDAMGILHEGTIVLAATYVRAIADLVLDAVLRNLSPNFVVLDDWLSQISDKRLVFELLSEATRYISAGQAEAVRQWILRNSNW